MPLAKKLPARFSNLLDFALVANYLLQHIKLTLTAVVFAITIETLNLLAIWAIGCVYTSEISLFVVFSAIPITLLIAMIPISVGGWGLREGAFVISLGLFGISSELALIISVTFRLGSLIVYLPALLWAFKKQVTLEIK